MSIECIGFLISVAGISFGVGYKIGLSKIVSTMELPCKILIKEVHRLSKKHNTAMKPNKVSVQTAGKNITLVSCQYFNNKTKKCDINSKKCHLL